MLRVIREVQPTYIVAENVRGLLNPEFEQTFEEICSSLESLNYSVQPFIIPACAVNAPHRRDRIWFVAHTNDKRRIGRCEQGQDSKRQIRAGRGNGQSFGESSINNSECAGFAINPNRIGCQDEQKENGKPLSNKERVFQATEQGRSIKQRGISESDCFTTDSDSSGLSIAGLESEQQEVSERFGIEYGNRIVTNADERLFGEVTRETERELRQQVKRGIIADTNGERLQRRVSTNGIEGQKPDDKQFIGCGRDWSENWLEVAAEFCRVDARVSNRVDRLRALGNSIVPQIAYELFRAIEEAQQF